MSGITDNPTLITLTTTVTSIITNDSAWAFALAAIGGNMFWMPLPVTLAEGDTVKITVQKVSNAPT